MLIATNKDDIIVPSAPKEYLRIYRNRLLKFEQLIPLLFVWQTQQIEIRKFEERWVLLLYKANVNGNKMVERKK